MASFLEKLKRGVKMFDKIHTLEQFLLMSTKEYVLDICQATLILFIYERAIIRGNY